MRFSILHISDLHRDLSDEVSNKWLLDSLESDFDRFDEQIPRIMKPKLCIVSGDLVHGVGLNVANSEDELQKQYAQAEEFLIDRGRTASYPTAPSQIPACGITAQGSSKLLTLHTASL